MIQIQKSFKSESSGMLYLVPTPIGNLEDMTFRAIRILKEADLILAEDTRHTIKLLNHFEINTPMASFHEHSTPAHLQKYLQLIQEGQTLALVSDAGMPLINDPGHPLVQAVLSDNLPVIALPGANAALTALVSSGLDSQRFTYHGFFPRESKVQKEMIALIGNRQETAIFYESPFRVKSTVQALVRGLSPETKIVLARELTKQYEEYTRGTLESVMEYLQEAALKGEFVLLIEGGTGIIQQTAESVNLLLPLKNQVEQLMKNREVAVKEAIKEVAKLNNIKKQEVYRAYHNIEE